MPWIEILGERDIVVGADEVTFADTQSDRMRGLNHSHAAVPCKKQRGHDLLKFNRFRNFSRRGDKAVGKIGDTGPGNQR